LGIGHSYGKSTYPKEVSKISGISRGEPIYLWEIGGIISVKGLKGEKQLWEVGPKSGFGNKWGGKPRRHNIMD
jgi:hypothetical protein